MAPFRWAKESARGPKVTQPGSVVAYAPVLGARRPCYADKCRSAVIRLVSPTNLDLN